MPQRLRLPAPKAYEVRVSCARLMPTISERTIKLTVVVERPITAIMTASSILLAKITLTMFDMNMIRLVKVAGMASFIKNFKLVQVLGAGALRSKIDSFSVLVWVLSLLSFRAVALSCCVSKY